MSMVRIPSAGAVGVNKDLSQSELPENAWSDAKNIRFLNGSAWSFYGHSPVYGTPSATPYHVLPLSIDTNRYWLYCGASSIYAVNYNGGVNTHTNLTSVATVHGFANEWTSTLLGGLPIVNSGGADLPLYWDLILSNKFVPLANWPASTYCRSIRSYKSFLIALGINKSGSRYPFMVKWSHPADPGTVPSSWNEADPTKDAGEYDLAEGYDPIVDGLQLRDAFMIYKEQSVWRMDFTGGAYIFKFSKVLGTSGAMNLNCIVEVDGWHFVLTGSDVIMHDGTQASSVLDSVSRRFLFSNIDVNGNKLCFVFKNPFMNEVFVCYPQPGSPACDKAMVWNYVDRTVSFRDIPDLNHAAFGPVPAGIAQTWASDSDPWDADVTTWSGPDFAPDRARVLLAPNSPNLYMLDGSAAQSGTQVDCCLERRGLSLGSPETMKLVRSVRPRISGNTGATINIHVGGQADPWSEPEWSPAIPFTIGSSVSADCLVSGRYISIRFESGTAYQFRLDSYDLDVMPGGLW